MYVCDTRSQNRWEATVMCIKFLSLSVLQAMRRYYYWLYPLLITTSGGEEGHLLVDDCVDEVMVVLDL